MSLRIANKPTHLGLLSLGSGLLLYLSWLVHPIFLFVAFIPLLEIDIILNSKEVKHSGIQFFAYVFFALLLWNVLNLSWLFHINSIGAILFLFIQVFLMTLPFILFRFTKYAINEAYGYFSWVLYWLSLEYLHMNWQISWPWLNLGYAFGAYPSWVQWYEGTGVLGGTLWALGMNVFIYLAIRSKFSVNRKVFGLYAVLSFLILYLYSLLISSLDLKTENEVSLTTIQPYSNFRDDANSYVESEAFTQTGWIFSSWVPGDVMGRSADSLKLAARASIDKARQRLTNLNFVEAYYNFKKIKYEFAFVEHKTRQDTLYPRKTAVLFIPWVDRLPQGIYLPEVNYQDNPFVFSGYSTPLGVLMGQEALYAHLVKRYVKSGANILSFYSEYPSVPAYEAQMRNYLRLKAIEFRRPVVWVSLTGQPDFIDLRGYSQRDVLAEYISQSELNISKEETFYAEHGDYLGRLAWFLAVGLFLTALVKQKVSTRKK